MASPKIGSQREHLTASSDGSSHNCDSGFSGAASTTGFSMNEAAVGVERGTDLLHCTVCGDLLTEPLLLDCLHSCCRQCMDAAVASEQGASSVMVCKVCKDFTEAAVRRENTFIEFQLQQHRTAVEQPKCGFCSEEGLSEQVADLWCSHCEKHLCHDCDPGHRKYNKHHLTTSVLEVSRQSSTTSPGAVTQLCRLHKKSLDHLCIQCKLPKCYDCGLVCSAVQHDLQFLKSPKTESFLSKIKEEIANFDKLLQDKGATLRLHRNLMEDLHSARREHMELLKRNKKLVLDSIDRTYQAAEESLQDKYDDLLMKAQGLVLAAEMLHTKASHAVRYAEHIAGSADIASFIQQETLLHTRLQLLTEKLKAVLKPLDAAECIRIEAATVATADMDAVTRKWIGVPQVATDDLCSKLASGCDITETRREANQPSSNTPPVSKMGVPLAAAAFSPPLVEAPTAFTDSPPVAAPRAFADGHGKTNLRYFDMPRSVKDDIHVVRVGADVRVLNESDRCYDVAVTSHNTVLIAQGDEGLAEYDYIEDETETVWQTSSGSVTAVDVVDDNRAVVGLRKAQLIAVLSCGGGNRQWNVKKYINVQSDPFTLAAHADYVAATLWRKNYSRGSYPGPTLVLLSLSSGTDLFQQDLDFSIFSVAVTARVVAAASWGRDKPGRRALASQEYLIAGYDHCGDMLWQREWDDRVYGMCAAPSGHILYLAVQETNSVTAIRDDNGMTLMNVMLSGQEISDPWRLSLTKGRGPAVLAVLESNFKTVTVYPVMACSRTGR